ncbi:MAG TPA: GntR family transcriptional regulator [Longimicrobiales bacterium]
MIATHWPKIGARTLSDQVYHVVRRRILERSLCPGEFVREQELSRALGVSRTPVREALGRLATEGFLERIPHHGFRVPSESLAELIELYPIVSALELLAGRLALPRLGDEELAALRACNQRLREARDRGDIEAVSAVNGEFHDIICQKSGNRRLVDMLRDLRSQVARLEVWYYSSREHTERSIREHDEIIDRIERGEFEDALELLRNNRLLTYRELLREHEREKKSHSAA